MASSTTGMTITLKSSDGEEFVISEMVAMQSQTLCSMIEDDCAQNAIPLPNVNSRILSKVIEFCKYHAEAEDMLKRDTAGEGSSCMPTSSKRLSEEDIRKWDMEFVELDQMTIFELLLAANYLNISKLLDASCQKVAEMIKDMTVEEIRETFNIENDYTPEEEEAVRRENQWAFQ